MTSENGCECNEREGMYIHIYNIVGGGSLEEILEDAEHKLIG